MDERDIRKTIAELVEREHRLRTGHELDDDGRRELAAIEAQLDQCWDLLRQRDALRDVGRDPGDARSRPVSQVESYLQ